MGKKNEKKSDGEGNHRMVWMAGLEIIWQKEQQIEDYCKAHPGFEPYKILHYVEGENETFDKSLYTEEELDILRLAYQINPMCRDFWIDEPEDLK